MIYSVIIQRIGVLMLVALLETNAMANIEGCDQDSWQCLSGQCIEDHELCDGKIDCSDRSDETTVACIANQCPHYAYRCAYGACVMGTKECNGNQDCADNSDELTFRCIGKWNNSHCAEDEFKCDSGQCIVKENACDGVFHCEDKSDETVQKCTLIHCPSHGFRCGYGACVSRKKKCNGISDCVDDSDEAQALCGRRSTSAAPHPSVSTSVTFPLETDHCIANLKPNLKAYYDSNKDEIKNGEHVELYATINYKCKENYKLIGNDSNFCFASNWTNTVPYCQKLCTSEQLRGATIKVNCEYEKFPISCRGPFRPRTKVRIRCAVGYEQPPRYVQAEISCMDDGEWNYGVFRCQPICGIEAPEGATYIVGGTDAGNNSIVPWHVGIYFDGREENKFEHICGGTILSAKVVISAAHCFWHVQMQQTYDVSLFVIGIGKYYRDYNAEEPLFVQKLRVSEIILHPTYSDYQGLYNADISLVVLVEFIVFQPHVLPICLESNLEHAEQMVRSDWLGKVAGWGLTKSGGSPSETLRVIDLPTTDYNTCKRAVKPEFQRYITPDKFCAGYTTGQSVCRGDSGGGLVFPKHLKVGVQISYLWGIVSTGPNKGSSCDDHAYVTFTNVQNYITLISEVIYNNTLM